MNRVCDAHGAGCHSHRPLRLCQSRRTRCGRGYSGKGLVGSTPQDQGVLRRRAVHVPFVAMKEGLHACTR